MTIVLPTHPGPQSATRRFLDFSAHQDGGLAAAGPTIGRLGNRYALAVALPPMRLEPEPGWGVGGRVWLNRLKLALRDGALLAWPQQGFNIGAPGVPVVAAATAANVYALPIGGARSGYIFREGQFFNVVVAGRHYLHSSAAEVVVAGDGTATLVLAELLRIAVPVGAALRMDPVIEGRLEAGKGQEWESDRSEIVRAEFMITEFAYGEGLV